VPKPVDLATLFGAMEMALSVAEGADAGQATRTA
jgi:hypothetical protein